MGVCDSKSSIIVSDVFFMELDDKFLLELCQLKSNGSSLLTLSSSGSNFILYFAYCIVFNGFTNFYVVSYASLIFFFWFDEVEYQVLNNSDSTTKLIEIADLLGKSIGMWHACV